MRKTTCSSDPGGMVRTTTPSKPVSELGGLAARDASSDATEIDGNGVMAERDGGALEVADVPAFASREESDAHGVVVSSRGHGAV